MRKEQILRIKSLKLTYSYLNESKVKRNRICRTIIENAFKTFSVPETIDRRAEVITKIIDKSIHQLEIEEEFEECQILSEVKSAIPKVVKSLKSKEKL